MTPDELTREQGTTPIKGKAKQHDSKAGRHHSHLSHPAFAMYQSVAVAHCFCMLFPMHQDNGLLFASTAAACTLPARHPLKCFLERESETTVSGCAGPPLPPCSVGSKMHSVLRICRRHRTNHSSPAHHAQKSLPPSHRRQCWHIHSIKSTGGSRGAEHNLLRLKLCAKQGHTSSPPTCRQMLLPNKKTQQNHTS